MADATHVFTDDEIRAEAERRATAREQQANPLDDHGFYSDEEIAAESARRRQPKRQPEDLRRVLAGGVEKGVAGMIGAPHDMTDLLDRTATEAGIDPKAWNTVKSVLMGATHMPVLGFPDQVKDKLPSGEQVHGAMQSADEALTKATPFQFGGQEPQSAAGHVVEAIGEAAPAAAAPGGLATKVTRVLTTAGGSKLGQEGVKALGGDETAQQWGALAGGTLGGMAPEGLGLTPLGKTFSRFGATPDERALRMIDRMMKDAKITPDQLQRTANKVQAAGGSTEELLFELLGEPGRRAARAVFNVRGPSAQIGENALSARKEGVGARLTQAASKATGVGGSGGLEEIGTFLDNLNNARQTQAGPLYDAAYGEVVPDDIFQRDLRPLMMGGDVQLKALGKAAEIADSEVLRLQAQLSGAQRRGDAALIQKLAGDIDDARLARQHISDLIEASSDPRIATLVRARAQALKRGSQPQLENGQPVYDGSGKQVMIPGDQNALAAIDKRLDLIGRGPQSINVRALDYFQRGLRSIAEGEGQHTTLGSAHEGSRREFNALLDAEIPAFGKARTFIAQNKGQEAAVEAGTKVFEMDDYQIAKATQGMSAADRDGFMVGVMRALQEKINRGDTAFVARLARDKNLRAQLIEALGGPKEARKFFGRVTREANQAANDNFIRSGSRTTPLAEDIKSLTAGEDELGFVSELAQAGGNVKGILVRRAADLYDRLRRPGIYNPRVNEALGTRLYGKATAPATRKLLSDMKGSRFNQAYQVGTPGSMRTGGALGGALSLNRNQNQDVQNASDEELLQAIGAQTNIGAPIDRSRPILENQDGSFSTERTITIGADGRFFNIPTIVGGRQRSQEEAIALWRAGQNQAVGDFATEPEALAAAQARSKQIGRVRERDRVGAQ